MSRFEDVTQDVVTKAQEIINNHFPTLRTAKILYIFDAKKRVSKGKVVLAQIRRPNDLVKYLTMDLTNDAEGMDYIVAIDKLVWRYASDEDKVRLLRHEFRHTLYDSDKDKYKLVGHSVEDFYEEIDLNRDDPQWARKLVEKIQLIYEQQEDNE